MATVLFICIHNAGRSQMAEAFLNSMSGGRHRGISAGSRPSESVNPVVVEAMSELGIDISHALPKKLTAELVREADLVVTMGCGEDACPIVPNEMREWDLDDPHGRSIEEVRLIRDQIKVLVRELVRELDAKSTRV